MAAPRERKVQTNLRLTPSARKKLYALCQAWGISQADVIELLVRDADLAPPKPKPSSPRSP